MERRPTGGSTERHRRIGTRDDIVLRTWIDVDVLEIQTVGVPTPSG